VSGLAGRGDFGALFGLAALVTALVAITGTLAGARLTPRWQRPAGHPR